MTAVEQLKDIEARQELAALREDKALLDWLDAQGNGMPWIARQSETDRGYRLHNTTRTDGSATVREAISRARKND